MGFKDRPRQESQVRTLKVMTESHMTSAFSVLKIRRLELSPPRAAVVRHNFIVGEHRPPRVANHSIGAPLCRHRTCNL